METIIIFFISFVIIIYLLRLGCENLKQHDLILILDSYGAIQVFDGEGLIAILYKDHTIDWLRNTSFSKMNKIKLISDRFEEEHQKLEDEANSNVIKKLK